MIAYQLQMFGARHPFGDEENDKRCRYKAQGENHVDGNAEVCARLEVLLHEAKWNESNTLKRLSNQKAFKRQGYARTDPFSHLGLLIRSGIEGIVENGCSVRFSTAARLSLKNRVVDHVH